MPILNREDAVEVESRIAGIFEASPDMRAEAVRGLFVEVLDFDAAFGPVDLGAAASSVGLPESVERVAYSGGVHVVFLSLETAPSDRVRKAELATAAKVVTEQLGGDLLLVVANASFSQLHLVYPSFEGVRPVLRRMVTERDLPRRTAIQQVSNIYWNHRELGSIRMALDKAFDIERVTKDFFAKYKELFEVAQESVMGFGADEAGKERKRRFVQTLFNRLMFVYFLSRKGWLTFKGDKDYLNALWRDYQATEGEHKNFYIDRLRLLFFEGLNNPRSQDTTTELEADRLIGHVPFLNGGLFEMTELDKQVLLSSSESVTVVPDEAIKPILSDLFDHFNFTVMESTPFDVEIAVDPEMLGKAFEELVTGRHDSGAYYTPRPVVSFMCREALKGYLEGQDTDVAPEAIARFVDQRDTSGISSVASARKVAAALDEVTVVDPACGSGAYLLGMMQELVELQTALFSVGVDQKGLYELKLHIIERNLYGVDIDDFAVNIAMLRLWLSLAIEYEGDKPPPLPNLDFKVLCGDSLLGPDPSAGVMVQGALGYDADRVRALGELKAAYMRASEGTEKSRLRREIEAAENAVREAMGEALGDAGVPEGVINWRLDFAEVFSPRQGFDIAVANPPYVRQENIGESKAALVQQYSAAVTARSDLYCFFYARALQVLRNGGMHVFVCSNSWLDVGYGAKLQEHLLRNGHVQAVYESAVERQFSTADINTIVSFIRNVEPEGEAQTLFVSLRDEFSKALADPDMRREIVRTRDTLLAAGAHEGKYQGDKWGGKYLRAPDIYHHILDEYSDKLTRLGDVTTLRRGVTTGANYFFYLTSERIKEFGIEARFTRPVMTSPQESRRLAVDPERLPHLLFLCHDEREDLQGTAALAYIQWGEAQGYHTRSTVRARSRWYDLGETAIAPLLINKMIDTTSRTFLSGEAAANNVFYEIGSEKATPTKLCAVLNSTICQLMINLEGRVNFGGGMLELAAYETANIPIVNPENLPDVNVTLFNSVEWDVLRPSAARWHIDGIVFDSMGLTTGERDSVYEGVVELVGNRKRRAASV